MNGGCLREVEGWRRPNGSPGRRELGHRARPAGRRPVGSALAQSLVAERARALASKGPASLPLLSDELVAVIERELARPDLELVADQDADRAPLP